MVIDNKKMMNVKKRIFDTEKALKGAYNGRFGKWQLFSYSLLTLAFAITYGWISRMYHYSCKTFFFLILSFISFYCIIN